MPIDKLAKCMSVERCRECNYGNRHSEKGSECPVPARDLKAKDGIEDDEKRNDEPGSASVKPLTELDI